MTLTHNSQTEAPALDIALVRDGLFSVLGSTETLGFIEQVGNVYVAHAGPDLGRAIEAGQSLSWDEAVAMVQRAHRARG